MSRWRPVASLAANYSKKPVHFIFANQHDWNDGVMEKIQPRLASGGWRDDSRRFTVATRYWHPGVDRGKLQEARWAREKELGTKVMGVYIVFDRAGTIAKAGPMTPAELGTAIDAALEAAPIALDTGAERYTELADLAKDAARGAKLGKTLAKCDTLIAEGGPAAAEARRLRDAIRYWAHEREQSAVDCLVRKPGEVEGRYKRLAADLKGHDLSKQVAARLKALKKAKQIRAAYSFRAIADQIEGLAPCSNCAGRLSCRSIALTCKKCLAERAVDLKKLAPVLDAWIAKHGDWRFIAIATKLRSRLPNP